MSVMLSHYPPSPSSLVRSSSPSSPSPRRVRSNPPQSRPSARAMSNLQVNSTVTPGLLSLSRPPSNQRSKQPTAVKKQQGESKPEQQPKLVPSSSNDSSSKPNPSTAKPSTTTAATTSSSSDAIPQPTVPQVPTPGKQRRTRRPKRSNSDPLFPTPSSPKENQQDVDESPKTSNPPRTPGPPSSSTPSGKASSPPRASTSDQSLGPNTPTPASKSARARGTGGGGGRRNEKSSTTLVPVPTPIPSSRAPPEADPNEHLYHSAPSESSFMLGPESSAPSGDGKRARGRSGKASKKKEGSRGSGREDAFVLDEEEGRVWDMPEKKGTDQLTWQQSLVSSSTPQFNSLSSPSNNRRSSPAPRNARATLSSNVAAVVAPQATSQHRHTASLTWQQALLPTPPPPAPSSNSAPATMRRRNSLSMSGLSIHGTSATPMRMDDSSKQRHSMLSVLSTPTKTTAIMPKEDAVGGRVGPRYAGGTFQNSPMAGDLPKPRFGGRM